MILDDALRTPPEPYMHVIVLPQKYEHTLLCKSYSFNHNYVDLRVILRAYPAERSKIGYINAHAMHQMLLDLLRPFSAKRLTTVHQPLIGTFFHTNLTSKLRFDHILTHNGSIRTQ